MPTRSAHTNTHTHIACTLYTFDSLLMDRHSNIKLWCVAYNKPFTHPPVFWVYLMPLLWEPESRQSRAQVDCFVFLGIRATRTTSVSTKDRLWPSTTNYCRFLDEHCSAWKPHSFRLALRFRSLRATYHRWPCDKNNDQYPIITQRELHKSLWTTAENERFSNRMWIGNESTRQRHDTRNGECHLHSETVELRFVACVFACHSVYGWSGCSCRGNAIMQRCGRLKDLCRLICQLAVKMNVYSRNATERIHVPASPLVLPCHATPLRFYRRISSHSICMISHWIPKRTFSRLYWVF